MPATVGEKYNSRHMVQGQDPHMEVGYIIVGAADENSAIAAMLLFAPATWTIGTVQLPLYAPEATALYDTIWEGKLTYGFGSISQTISFDTGGGQSKVKQSNHTVSYPATGTIAPDFGGSIGVTKSGVEGADVTIPALTFTIKKTMPPSLLTSAYVKQLAVLTGNYNNATFNGFEAGEVRFDGATGDQKQIGQYVDVSFKFTCSQNSSGATFAGISGIDKLGWQYLWVLYEEREDTTAHFLAPRPLAVFVEDLPNCQPVDFSLLGIGT
jgi:hypothetical protein